MRNLGYQAEKALSCRYPGYHNIRRIRVRICEKRPFFVAYTRISEGYTRTQLPLASRHRAILTRNLRGCIEKVLLRPGDPFNHLPYMVIPEI